MEPIPQQFRRITCQESDFPRNPALFPLVNSDILRPLVTSMTKEAANLESRWKLTLIHFRFSRSGAIQTRAKEKRERDYDKRQSRGNRMTYKGNSSSLLTSI